MKGTLLVISGPAGAGKGTVIEELLGTNKDLSLSVSVTTRKPRSGEANGVNYFFVDKDEFQKMIDNGELLEYAFVHGNYYGTPLSYVNEKLKGGDVILEIDVQGAKAIKKMVPQCATIFIAPPSQGELEKRLRGRNTEEEDEIQRRLKTARGEIEQIYNYDYVVVNDSIEQCATRIMEIVRTRKYKVKHNLSAIKRLLEGGEF